MNASAEHLLNQHDGRSLVTMPGKGFEHLTDDTACIYLLDSDLRVLSVILETTADEPLDDVCDFFVQQIAMAGKPSASMREMGIGRSYGNILIVRLALDGVPDWQKEVIQQRIGDAMPVIGTTHTTWSEDDDEDA